MSFRQNIRILIIRGRAAISRKIQTGALKFATTTLYMNFYGTVSLEVFIFTSLTDMHTKHTTFNKSENHRMIEPIFFKVRLNRFLYFGVLTNN